MSEVNVPSKLKSRFGDVWTQYALAFIFPVLTVLSALIITQCYPFGSHTMLTVDLYHQYGPFLVTLRDKILSSDSLFYSWNDGLGQEYYASFANYAASPLNIFCIFFTPKTMPVFIGLITCIRAGLASVFMLMFLSENDNRRVDNITVVFASSYALCGWFISYFWNIMWCDAVVLLPLVALGLRRLLLEKKIGLYCISLAVLVFSNYYAGFFVCLFLILFAPVYYICLFTPSRDRSVPHRLCPKTFFRSAGLFAGASLLAVGATAILTIPTYSILQHCSATGDKLTVDLTLQNTLFDFLGRFMVAANPNIRDGMANVYCGLVIVLLLPMFFMLPASSGISLRHKIGFGALLGIMYLSFANRTLNFIWHGMHFPNQIPYRESFLMCFVMVFMGFLTIRRIKNLSLGVCMGTVAGCAAFLVLYEKFGDGQESYIQIGLTLVYLFVQGATLHVISEPSGKRSAFFCETLITITMMIEIFTSATISIATVASNEGFASYDFYGKNYAQIYEHTVSVEGSEGHSNFERTELFPNNICNIQAMYNIKGMSIFSSTAREDLVRYMRNFGFHNNNINGLRNAGITRVTATLLGVRNLVAIENTQTVPDLFDQEYNAGEVTVYGNPDALSVGYMVSDDILDYAPKYEEDLDVFSKTNEWVRSMGVGSDVYTPISMNVGESENMSTSDTSGKCLVYGVVTSSDKCNFTVTVDDAEIGSDVYIYANSSKGGSASVTNGDSSRNFEIRAYQIISLGRYEGTPITLTVNYSSCPDASLFVYSYELNQDGYKDMVDTLSSQELNVSSYDSTSLNGSIDVTSDGLMLLTVPYSEGWSATVDGQPCSIVPVQDALMGIELTAGHHEISLSYAPKYFKAGLTITFISIALIAAVIFMEKHPIRRGARFAAAADGVPGEMITDAETAARTDGGNFSQDEGPAEDSHDTPLSSEANEPGGIEE